MPTRSRRCKGEDLVVTTGVIREGDKIPRSLSQKTSLHGHAATVYGEGVE